MDSSIFKKRREKLIETLSDNQSVIIFAASMPSYPRYFLQDKNYYYLTGLEINDAVLAISKQNGKGSFTLFIERGIPEREVWDGKKISKDEAKKMTGIENIKYLDEFDRFVNGFLAGFEKIYVNDLVSAYSSLLNKSQQFVQKALLTIPYLQFRDFSQIIGPLRNVKDNYEINQIKQAIDTTEIGIRKIYKKSYSGMNEYELEAIFYHEAIRSGSKHMGFKPIIASGINAATLHYADNNCVIKDGDLILLDVGTACNNYSADISRTFPVDGRFSRRQQEIYEKVLEIQKVIIGMVKPKISFPDLNKAANELITKALFDLKLIKNEDERTKYYMHSIGHHLGLDTHDIGQKDSILEVGNVITIEPGIYIPEEGIGIRIEDDILVTESGYQNLSVNIPKEIEELEDICRK